MDSNNGWQKRKLGYCAELIRDSFIPNGEDVRPYIGLEHIQQQTLKLLDVGKSTDVVSGKFVFKFGDILFGKLRSYFRKVVRPKFDGVCSTDIWVIRAKGGTDQGFLFYLMASEKIVALASQGSEGTKMPRAKWDFVGKLDVDLPPLSEQQKIAFILSALDDKIELNHEMNSTLEAMAQAIFKHWFVDFEFPNDEGQPYQSSGGEMVYSEELGKEIPRGWGVTSLVELHSKKRDCVITGPFGSNLHAFDYRETGAPLILVKHVDGGQIIEDDLPLVGDHKLPELERYRLQEGDIAFTRVGAVGRTAYIHPRYAGWLISGQMLRVRVDRAKINPRYLSELYLTQSFHEKIENYAVGSTRPSLNTKIVENLKILVPPINIQNIYEKIVANFDDQIQDNITESSLLKELRDTLLPKLLSGEIQVNNLSSNRKAQKEAPA